MQAQIQSDLDVESRSRGQDSPHRQKMDIIHEMSDTKTQPKHQPDDHDDSSGGEHARGGQLVRLLRDLLASERANSEQRRQNNLALQKYIQNLQTDYLRLQSDMMQALEFGHKLKAQKQTQIECLETNLKQKDDLIQSLQIQLDNLDETKLRSELKVALEKQQELHRLELDQYRQQISLSEQQLSRERANTSQLLQQFQEKLDSQLKLHERDLDMIRTRLNQSQEDLERLLSEPQNLLVKTLRGDKMRLESQVEELQLSLEDNRAKYDSMQKRLEMILLEQERLAQQNQEELDRLQQLNVDQRRAVNELKIELEDKLESIQLYEFNLNRSEKRVKNLLGALKNKEATYRELVNQNEVQKNEELEKVGTKLRTVERRVVELESELTAKQNELVAARLEQENRIESLRNDRDERLTKLAQEKANLIKEVQTIELKLACESEQSQQKSKQLEQIQREVRQFQEEAKRLSIELTKSEAKLHANQQEMQTALRSLQEREMEKLRDGSSRDKLMLAEGELEEERLHSKRLKANIDELKKDNEKLCTKLSIAESNLLRTRSAVDREHEKLMREYEKKLEAIRSEQVTFDRSKLRYKRYGFKLKKYCEHLKRVHAHLCSPSSCGYLIGPVNSSQLPKSLPTKQKTSPATYDNVNFLDSDGDEQLSESPYYDEISGDEYDETQAAGSPLIRSSYTQAKSTCRPAERFIIKRTGLKPAISSPTLQASQPIATSRNNLPTQSSRVPHHRYKSTNSVHLNASCDSVSRGPLAPLTNTSRLGQREGRETNTHPNYYYTNASGKSLKSDAQPSDQRSRPAKVTPMVRKATSTSANQPKQQKQSQVLRTVI